ncbi:hypothetical protein TFLX_04313 [Thermoflexales bacterium]|nr:hypothetical protein TFLX_04313 [Thermoflexales bacterium]
MENHSRHLSSGYLILLATPILNVVLIVVLTEILGAAAYCLWPIIWLGGTMLIIQRAQNHDDELSRRHRNVAVILLALIMSAPLVPILFGAAISTTGSGGHAAIGPGLLGLGYMLIGMLLYGVFYVLAVLVSLWGIITLSRRST